MQNIILTRHAELRANERMCIKTGYRLFRQATLAWKRGYDSTSAKNAWERQVLKQAERNCDTARLFNGFMFIFMRTRNESTVILITVYEVNRGKMTCTDKKRQIHGKPNHWCKNVSEWYDLGGNTNEKDC